MARAAAWTARHPIGSIFLVSCLAVVINCYPVIFCGDSYVSPYSAGQHGLVYDEWPLLPGMEKYSGVDPKSLPSFHGSDTGATMLWGVPMGYVESRSILDHGTLPLWNRHSHCGDTLIGQAISELGDPLQLIVIFGRGSALAWDVKFLAAKILFCMGFGCLIRLLIGNLPLALLFSYSSAYCGAYFYIYNHPSFFELAYAPWILFTALKWLDAGSAMAGIWLLPWLLVNFACLNAGHVEVAAAFIGGLNAVALAVALVRAGGLIVLGRMVLGTGLFFAVSAPVWLAFLTSLSGAYSEHETVAVRQLPSTLLAGAFDDLFYLLLRSNDLEAAPAPGGSLLVLAGCCCSICRWRQLRAHPFFWANTLAILWWAACIFKVIPATVLGLVPLFNRVGHVDTDFSYLLIFHLTIQSAYGFYSLRDLQKGREIAMIAILFTVILSGLLLAYRVGYWHQPIPWNYVWISAIGAIGAPVVYVLVKKQTAGFRVAGWAVVFLLGFLPLCRFGLYNFGDDHLFMRPGPRVGLNEPSEAIEHIRSANSAPFRVTGLGWSLHGDYAAVYGLESICSCAPISRSGFIDLVRNFPGIFTRGWVIEVVDPNQAQPLLNLLNVRYLLGPPKLNLPPQSGYRLVGRSDFATLENPQVWPRAFFTDHVVPCGTRDDFIQQLTASAREPFIAMDPAVIAAHPEIGRLPAGSSSPAVAATGYQLTENTTAFDLHAPAAGVVCLTEEQNPGFRVRVNNQPAEVLEVNRVFKGVYLPQAGDYHIRFTYRPSHWNLALTAFWGGVGIAVLYTLFAAWRFRSSSEPGSRSID